MSNLTSPKGECFAGYYCTGGSTEPAPSQASDIGGPCPVGKNRLDGGLNLMEGLAATDFLSMSLRPP